MFQQILSDAAGQPVLYRGQFTGQTLTQTPGTFIVLRDNGGSSAPFATNFATATPIPRTGNVSLLENPDITTRLQSLNPGAAVLFQSGTGLNQSPSGVAGLYFVQQNYQISSPALAANVVLPSSGGVVGRTKIADDNNPVPGDRVILNYDLYGGTVLTPGGYDVHRFAVGGECAFLDGMMSAELLMPFASTLDPVSTLGGLTSRSTEWGNLNLILKALVFAGEGLDVAAGVGVAFPTAADAVVKNADGSELLRVKNQSYMVTPYIAAQVVPTDGWFAQGWVQVSFDATGSDVLVAPTPGSPLVNAGTIHDSTLLQMDFQVGYWLIREPYSSGLRGLAPFLELHYNRPLGTTGPLVADGLILAGNPSFNELNLSVGATALIGPNTLVSVGMVFPLRDGNDRFFDYQFGARVNWFFGPRGHGDACAAYPAAGMPGAGAPAYPGAAPGVAMPPPGSPPVGTPSGSAPTDPLARIPEAGTLASPTFNPNFFGDLIGVSAMRRLPSGLTLAQVPVLPRYAGLKATDNDGPRPSDRVFFSYNRYSGVNGDVNPPGSPDVTLRRQIVGFETLIGDDASLGVRLPFLQMGGSPEIEDRVMGDLTLVGKYAVLNDPWSGNVATLGLTVTLPTGDRDTGLGALASGQPAPRAVFVQPWAGVAWSAGDVFFEAVSSVVLPTDPVYPVMAFNSVGVGYWVYRNGHDGLLRGVAPVAELHINTPLNHRGDDNVIFLDDQVNLTTGVYLQFPRLTLGGSICVPLISPKPYDLEAMVSLNYQF
jgi:hypothetical protein